ncbi:MAG: DUF2652 domain-containing protein [Gemmatimonadetes bacterium]|nr:MAG: DUF2652 domain-containing protein [Gemmatimonadota bacterium]
MTPAVLLIADISGYTRFVREHATAADHARRIVVSLLRAMIDASEPPLRVAELEGDAVFFYALAEDGDVQAVADAVRRQIPRLFEAFVAARAREHEATECPCPACSNIGGLELKQVAHTGEVAVETIGPFEKLFGLDVIVVHRLLKNSVPATRYVLQSEAAERVLGPPPVEPRAVERRREPVEGLGEMEVTVYILDGDGGAGAEGDDGAEAGAGARSNTSSAAAARDGAKRHGAAVDGPPGNSWLGRVRAWLRGSA